MERGLEIEVGVPVASEVPGGYGVESGAFPAGRYAAVVHTGRYDRLIDPRRVAGLGARARTVDPGRRGGFAVQLESYLTNPEEEPDVARHETEVAYLLAG